MSTYEDLVERYERISYVRDAGGLLGWDQQVTMPEGGTPARSKQQSAVSAVSHDLLTDDETGALLESIEEARLDGDQRAVVREIRREYRRAVRVPGDLVEEISERTSNALPVWEQAREESDFEQFAPELEEILALKREYADHVDPEADPYAVLFADYEPYIDVETAERVLDRLREELVPLVEAIAESDVELATDAFEGTFDPEVQEQVSREALDVLGHDWDHSRLDTSTHPFTQGTQFDARITTRFDPEDPLDALASTVHEFGHATYMLGLPRERYGTPLGDDRGLTVHESQSRLWENHVARSRPFWQRMLPVVRDHFDGLDDVTARDAYEAANQVYDDNPIRVEADELTYHTHILLRFEIERDLVRGDLDVAEVPQVWNDKMEAYLGFRPETDAEGCLQDIHWTHGSFGYFPTYTLGSVLAAQLYAAAESDIDDLDDHLAAGDVDPLHEWLGERIHRHGQRYTTPDLVEQATGEPLTADYFLDYAKSKYGELYDL
ncbi:MAG: carboxypeptidase M32 [Haloarculaceae archaeon]